jgi:hypothetical protein
MFKVLTCLALAMTATAGLLSWIEPAGPTQSDAPDLTVVAAQARQAVTGDTSVSLGRWCRIDVALCDDPLGGRADVLAAVPSNDQYHFLVGNAGVVQTNPCWCEQASIARHGDAVRVGVYYRSGESAVPLPQGVALQALLHELNRCCAEPSWVLPVSVVGEFGFDEWQAEFARSLRELVASSGRAR